MYFDEKMFQRLLESEVVIEGSDLFEADCGYDALMADLICEMTEKGMSTGLLDALHEKVQQLMSAQVELAYYYGAMNGLLDGFIEGVEESTPIPSDVVVIAKIEATPNKNLLFTPDFTCVVGCMSEDVTVVEIPEGVTHIAPNAFADCYSVEEVILPDGILYIGEGAFSSCEGLEKINLPESLVSIGAKAFAGCCNLKISKLPEDLLAIGESAFSSCTIEECCLWEVEELGESAFERCELPKGIVIMNGDLWVPSLREQSAETFLFGDETSWREGQCPSIVCRKYSVFDLSRTMYRGDRNIVYRMLEGTGNEIVECGEFTIQNNALLSYTGKETEVHLPEGIRYIAEDAFAQASQIEKLYLPKSLALVAFHIFAPLADLSNLYVMSTDVNALDGFDVHESLDVTVHAQKGSVCDLKYEDACDSICHFSEAIRLEPFSYRIDEDGVLWDYEGSLEEFTVPDGVKEIGEGCFECACDLLKINLPEGLQRIGARAFSSVWIVSLHLPESVIEIGDEAFYSAEDLKEINLPEGLKKIGKNAFGKTAIEEITIPESIELIDDYAFCYSLNLKVVNCKAERFDYGVYILGDGDMPRINAPKLSYIFNATSGMDIAAFSECILEESLKEDN